MVHSEAHPTQKGGCDGPLSYDVVELTVKARAESALGSYDMKDLSDIGCVLRAMCDAAFRRRQQGQRQL